MKNLFVVVDIGLFVCLFWSITGDAQEVIPGSGLYLLLLAVLRGPWISWDWAPIGDMQRQLPYPVCYLSLQATTPEESEVGEGLLN